MTLGQNIARLRAQKNLSQGDLADALEVSRQSVSKWETDASIPELDKLLRLAELFGVTLDELVKGESAQPEAARGEAPDKESAGAYTAAAPAARHFFTIHSYLLPCQKSPRTKFGEIFVSVCQYRCMRSC